MPDTRGCLHVDLLPDSRGSRVCSCFRVVVWTSSRLPARSLAVDYDHMALLISPDSFDFSWAFGLCGMNSRRARQQVGAAEDQASPVPGHCKACEGSPVTLQIALRSAGALVLALMCFHVFFVLPFVCVGLCVCVACLRWSAGGVR